MKPLSIKPLSIKPLWPIVIAAAVVFGCNNTTADKNKSPTATPALPEHISLLTWAKTADAAKDAVAAIAKKDYRLWSVAGRGVNLPGIDISQRQSLAEKCGTQIIQGSTDAVRDQQHLALLKKAYAYAERYNQIVAKVC
ncbi:MAG: hypothetical protein AAFZ92_03225 [Pseudomonadota bacterium]